LAGLRQLRMAAALAGDEGIHRPKADIAGFGLNTASQLGSH